MLSHWSWHTLAWHHSHFSSTLMHPSILSQLENKNAVGESFKNVTWDLHCLFIHIASLSNSCPFSKDKCQEPPINNRMLCWWQTSSWQSLIFGGFTSWMVPTAKNLSPSFGLRLRKAFLEVWFGLQMSLFCGILRNSSFFFYNVFSDKSTAVMFYLWECLYSVKKKLIRVVLELTESC